MAIPSKKYPPYFYGDDEDYNPDLMAEEQVEAPTQNQYGPPAASKPAQPTPEEALRAYLMKRKSEDDALTSPQALQKKEADRQLSMDRMAFNTFIPTMEKAGAMVGTVGDRTPKTILDKPSDQWIKYYGQQDQNAEDAEKMGMERTGMNDRLVEYLTNMNRQKDEAQKGRDQQLTVLDKTQGFQTGRDAAQHDYDMEKQQTGIDAGMEKQGAEQDWRSGENVLDRQNRKDVAGISGNNALQRIQVQGVEARKTNAAKPAGGKLGPDGKPVVKTSVSQDKYADYAKGMREANAAIDGLQKKGYDGSSRVGHLKRDMGKLGAYLGVTNDQDKAYDTAVRSFAAGVYRSESGAAVKDEELADVKMRYFPQPGDSPERVKALRALRESKIKSYEGLAMSAMQKVNGGSNATGIVQKMQKDPTFRAKMLNDRKMLRSLIQSSPENKAAIDKMITETK